MIIIGYPGIGKSTLARKKNSQYIDLESSCFNDANGKKSVGWETIYCRIAVDLCRQGYDVFVSSHVAVQNRLSTYINTEDINIVCAFPSKELVASWVHKLEDRFLHSNNVEETKNKLAYERALTYFTRDITALSMTEFDNIVIEDMNYDLDKLIKKYKKGHRIK